MKKDEELSPELKRVARDGGTEAPFTDPMNLEHVVLKEDTSLGTNRTEVVCKTCGAHLGHVFNDGPAKAGGKRYCINSVSLAFRKAE